MSDNDKPKWTTIAECDVVNRDGKKTTHGKMRADVVEGEPYGRLVQRSFKGTGVTEVALWVAGTTNAKGFHKCAEALVKHILRADVDRPAPAAAVNPLASLTPEQIAALSAAGFLTVPPKK